MSEERDFIVIEDEEGNSFELDVIDYFVHNGQQYAVLIDPKAVCDCGHDHEHGHHHSDGEECDCEGAAYIMKVVVNEEEDTEEFEAVDDGPLFDELSAIVDIRMAESLYDEDEDDDEDDEDWDDDEDDDDEDDD